MKREGARRATSPGISSSFGRSKSRPQTMSPSCCSSRTASRAQKYTSFRKTTRSAGHMGLLLERPLGRPHAVSLLSAICHRQHHSSGSIVKLSCPGAGFIALQAAVWSACRMSREPAVLQKPIVDRPRNVSVVHQCMSVLLSCY